MGKIDQFLAKLALGTLASKVGLALPYLFAVIENVFIIVAKLSTVLTTPEAISFFALVAEKVRTMDVTQLRQAIAKLKDSLK